MDANALRALQAPLKARYRESPSAARTPAHAEARLVPGAIACSVKTWSGETMAGLHAAAGGDGSQACSADMLLEALIACAGVTLSAVATAMGVDIKGGRVTADGHWDARGTLGIDKATPVGMTDIAVAVELDTSADAQTIDRLIKLTERYCVILQTLAGGPKITVSSRIRTP